MEGDRWDSTHGSSILERNIGSADAICSSSCGLSLALIDALSFSPKSFRLFISFALHTKSIFVLLLKKLSNIGLRSAVRVVRFVPSAVPSGVPSGVPRFASLPFCGAGFAVPSAVPLGVPSGVPSPAKIRCTCVFDSPTLFATSRVLISG